MSGLNSKQIMANNIKYYMRKNAVDRKKLCADLNLSYTTVSSWIQADSYPRIDKIELMAKYFKVDKSDLVEDHSDLSNKDLEKMLDDARSYNGKPLDDHDRSVIKGIIEGYYSSK